MSLNTEIEPRKKTIITDLLNKVNSRTDVHLHLNSIFIDVNFKKTYVIFMLGGQYCIYEDIFVQLLEHENITVIEVKYDFDEILYRVKNKRFSVKLDFYKHIPYLNSTNDIMISVVNNETDISDLANICEFLVLYNFNYNIVIILKFINFPLNSEEIRNALNYIKYHISDICITVNIYVSIQANFTGTLKENPGLSYKTIFE